MATIQQLTTVVHIKVNGSDLPEDQIRRVVDVVAEQNLHLPDMCVLSLQDVGSDQNTQETVNFRMLDNQSFKIGDSLEVRMGRGDSPTAVFKGEVTAIELDVNEHHPPTLIIRGYAKSHRLHRARQSKSYLNVMDSDLATQIAQQAGLSAQVDSSGLVHDYVFQTNQTGWEFLKARAARIGYEIFVDDTTLHFRKPQRDQDPAPDLHLWENLLQLKVKVTSAFQAGTVIVKGWDIQQKAAIVGTATRGRLAPEIGLGKSGAQVSQEFGDAKFYVVNQPVTSQSEADTLAQSVFDSLDGVFIQAEGTCIGDADVRPGRTVKLPNLGSTASGKYYITSATHQSNVHEGYSTTFVVSGKQSNSILDLLEPANPTASGLIPTVVVGIVTDNSDPDGGMGRVKVKFPWLDDQDTSWWARIASPMAGSGRGFYFLPEVNDEVLVAFEHGDLTRPYILGALWNGQDKPPKANSAVANSTGVNERIIKTRAGHIITLVDTDGSESIQIIDKTGNNKITIESSNNKISITSDGDTAITTKGKTTINAQQNVEVTTQADAKVTALGNVAVNATGNVDVVSTGDTSVKASGNAKVEAQSNISVEASAQLSLKGAMVSVEAQGEMSIKSSGPLTIQGAIVNIN